MMNHEMFAGMGFLWMLIVGAIFIVPAWRICQRIVVAPAKTDNANLPL